MKHARVYTLAEKFGVDKLKGLATSKIHCVNSTAKGEIQYARYVYAYTSKEDTSIRAPVANFWATRSHTLRSEAEEEFRSLCLEYPQFGYDVLSKNSAPSCHQLLLISFSSRVGREAQARGPRKTPSCPEQRAQATTTQQCVNTIFRLWKQLLPWLLRICRVSQLCKTQLGPVHHWGSWFGLAMRLTASHMNIAQKTSALGILWRYGLIGKPGVTSEKLFIGHQSMIYDHCYSIHFFNLIFVILRGIC